MKNKLVIALAATSVFSLGAASEVNAVTLQPANPKYLPACLNAAGDYRFDEIQATRNSATGVVSMNDHIQIHVNGTVVDAQLNNAVLAPK